MRLYWLCIDWLSFNGTCMFLLPSHYRTHCCDLYEKAVLPEFKVEENYVQKAQHTISYFLLFNVRTRTRKAAPQSQSNLTASRMTGYLIYLSAQICNSNSTHSAHKFVYFVLRNICANYLMNANILHNWIVHCFDKALVITFLS